MRNAFIDELIIAAENNNRIMLIVGDLGYGVIEPFAERFPKQFINAGVSEQNMMGLAAGLASENFHVFVYSIANFPTYRCAEQIRNDVDYHNLPVTIVAVGGGLAYGNLGYSHHAVQDYALLRVMPNMMIASPGDPFEVRACMKYLINNPQPSYLRLGKAGEPNIHASIPKVSPGKWLNIIKGENTKTYLTTGATLELTHKILLNNSCVDDKCSLYTLPLWSMRSKTKQSNQLDKFTKVITVEDHLIDGGFGSWILEAQNESSISVTQIKIKALSPKVCGMVGKQLTLNTEGGLTESNILK